MRVEDVARGGPIKGPVVGMAGRSKDMGRLPASTCERPVGDVGCEAVAGPCGEILGEEMDLPAFMVKWRGLVLAMVVPS